MVFPLGVAVVCSIFAWQVGRDYAARRRPYQALWMTALIMSAIASIAYAVAAAGGSAAAFRLYYVLGALLVAPYTGLGSLHLVLSPRLARILRWTVHAPGALGTVLIWRAPIDAAALAALAGSSGRGVLEPGAWLACVIVLNVFGTVAVGGVALVSALRAVATRQDGRFALGNVVIGAGFLTVAAAGSVARWWPGWDGAFWVIMAAGWAIAYAGFRIVGAAREARRAQSAGQAATARGAS